MEKGNENRVWCLNEIFNLGISGIKSKNEYNRSIAKYKVRLVAKSYNQRKGIDYEETFSLLVKPDTIRVVLSIVVSKKWKMKMSF